MKTCLLNFLGLLLCLSLNAQTNYTCRYWFDENHAQSETIQLSDSLTQMEMNVAGLSEGIHSLYIMVKDTSANWGSPQSYMFIRLADTLTGGSGNAALTYHCWFDQDYSTVQEGSLGNGHILLDVQNLDEGIHTVNVQLEGISRSVPQSYMFIRLADTLTGGSGNAALTYHCWFDEDYSTQQSGTLGNGHILLDVQNLTEGIHTVSVMLEGSTYSVPQSYMFIKLADTLTSGTGGALTYHCWFDEDYSTKQSGMLGNGHILLDVQNLAEGIHTVSVMLEGSTYSVPQSYMFIKLADTLMGGTGGALVYHCWFDEDYSTKQSGTLGNGHILLDVQDLDEGIHTVSVMVEGNSFSVPQSYMFIKLADTLTGGSGNAALTYHCWFDQDYSTVQEGSLGNGHILLDIQDLDEGIHIVHIIIEGNIYGVPMSYTFEKASIYVLNALPNNPAMGSVSGGGEYNRNDTVMLTAVPNACSNFVSWNDGNTDNPRTITVVSDTTLIAMFESINQSNDITATICEGSVYTENGFNVSEAGTYTQTLQTINGCDSIVTLNLTVNPLASTNLTAAICEGSVYSENGFNVNEAGTYTQNLQTINGCDSIVTLNLTVNPLASTNLTAAICEGSIYTENGFNASEAGTYTQTLQTINGCDSIVTLNLTISNVVNNDITAAICEGSVYTENGFNVSEAGTHTQTLQTINGCDSIVTLTLTVNPVENTNLSAAICEGSVYTENGFNVSEAGTHTLNLQTINGCDSIVTLTLTVNPVANTTLSAAICEGSTYIENGFNESETGIYTQNLQTVNGCDSIVTLNLTVSTVINNDITAAICEGSTYTENGFNVSEPGTYTQNLQSVNGCDSVVTLTLTVNPTYNITIDANINEGETYEENGFSESEAGTYVHTLQSEFGCDSVITLNLTVNSSLNDVVANAIEVSLYPNPAQSFVNMELSGEASETMVQLFDIQGKILRTYTLENGKKTLRIDLDGLPAACYYLHIISDNRVVVKKIIKNN